MIQETKNLNIYNYYTRHVERFSFAVVAATSDFEALRLVIELVHLDREGDWLDNEIQLVEEGTILGEPRVVYFLSAEL